MRLDEESILVRTKVDTSSRRIVRLVPVFILYEFNRRRNNVCQSSSQTNYASLVYIKTANESLIPINPCSFKCFLHSYIEKSQFFKPPLVLSGMMVLFFYMGWFAVPNEIEDNVVFCFMY